ncbi:4576_t:CDS:2 [Funneliformis caledonium]|uniref:4576_t:CDS:1 n=1 Tax=Funneliformis caledonium TaxID=1117310 RepID=A0A9N9AAX8_9GLOM|nr:4576_t:CDS:2 [Funneliformis caledonium]
MRVTRSKLDSKTGENSSTMSTIVSKFSIIIKDADLEDTTIKDINLKEVFKPKIISSEKRTESTKEHDQELLLCKTSISQIKLLFANIYKLKLIDNINNITTQLVSSTDEQNTAFTAYNISRSVSSIDEQNMVSIVHTALRSVFFMDEQNTTFTTSIDCINFNNLAPMFIAFV